MDGFLKASTATSIKVGPYKSTDGLTGKANLKISAGVFQIAKNGGTFANKTRLSIGGSSGLGWYTVYLSSADVSTVGNLQYKSSLPSAVAVFGSYAILPKTIYSAWFGSGYTPVNVIQVEGTDATNQLSTAVGANKGAYAAAIKSLGVNYVSSVGLVKKLNANVVSAGVVATGTLTNAKLATGAFSGGTFTAGLKGSIGTAVKNAIGTGTGFTSIPWNANWDAEVQSEATDALNAYDPPTKAELDTAQVAVKVAANGLSGGAVTAALKGSIGTAVWATATRQLTGTQTFNLTGNVTGNIVGNVTGSVGSIVSFKANSISAGVIATGALTNAKFAAGALSAGVFKSTAIPGQGAPPAATTLPAQVAYLYKFMRNQVVVDSTTGVIRVYADNGSTIDHKASISDAGGTFTRTKFISGA